MKKNAVPIAVLGLLCAGYLIFIAGSASLLPERVASHFGGDGQPNVWMPRGFYLRFIAGIGLGVTALFVSLAYGTRFLPTRLINLPQRNYWLAPEHRAETFTWLCGAMLWFSCLMISFLAGIHYLTIEANRSNPVHLPAAPFAILVAAFLIATVGWVVTLFRHFSKLPDLSQPDKK
ncbi:MAG: DUF1648 domain-containing protein [Verrucomicrobiota bacterium]|jgi:serine/threonine-protein kinase